jgi:hypothetical protein
MASLSQSEREKLLKALKKHYKADVLSGKGGFFIRGKGHISLATARKVTGIKGQTRQRRPKSGGYGDYAIIRKIAGRM